MDYYRAVIDIETYRKRLDSVYLYIDRALEVFPGNTELYARKGHAQGYAGKLSQSIGSYKKALKYADTDSLRGVVWDISATPIISWKRPDGRIRNGTNTAAGVSRLTTVRCIITTITRWCSITTPILSVNRPDPRRLDRAFAMAARAVELDGNNATLLDTYAWVLFRLGRLQEARRTMQQAISFDRSENPELYLHYGDILAALGEKFMAETYWRKALEKDMMIPRRSKSVSGNSNPSPDYATSLEPFVSFPAAGEVGPHAVHPFAEGRFVSVPSARCGVACGPEYRPADRGAETVDRRPRKADRPEEQEISKLKKGRASAEETVRRLARQIDSRNQLLDVTERDARKLEVEVARTDSVARGLSASLDAHKRRYAEMVREAYRNYKHNNYLTYLFSSSDFNQVARRITNLREVAAMRERQMEQIVTLSEQVSVERTRLTGQQRALDSVKRSLTTQRTRLQKDSQAARANIKQLSKKEKAALQQKIAREQRLDVAIDELRKLTRGNKEGNTFTAKTSNLRLPVVGGGVKRYKGNMAEIAGPKGRR